MARVHDELLNVHIAVAEARERLLLSRKVLLLKVLLALRETDSASAAACGCLYHYGVAYLGGYLASLLDGGYYAVGAGNDRNSRRYHRLLCGSLVAHRVHDLRGRTYKRNSAGPAQPREICVFRQKSETRVNSLGVGYLACRDYRLGVEIAVLGSRRSYAYRLVGYLGMQRGAVSLGIHRNGLYTEFAAGAHNAYRYLAAVRNKYLVKHSVSSRFYSDLGAGSATAKEISAVTTFLPLTVATASPKPIGPFFFVIVT